MAELPPKPAGLVIGKERARGSYGAVYSGELNGNPVVVKRIHLVLVQAPNNDKLMSDFYRECRILSAVRHANVVSFVGAYWDEETKEPLLVMEAAKENLRQYLERNKSHLSVEKQVAICSSMAEGLSFLHARAEPIVHRDLKPENVLVWEDGTIKIADFGQSKLLDHPQNYMMTTQPGTVAYMPPEALKRNPQYTSKVDVFSLGVVMLEVGTQSPSSVWLEGIGTVPEVERHKDDLAVLPDTHPLKPLIVWCLQDNHESRPDVQSTLDQVKLLVVGLKNQNFQQVISQLEGELRDTKGREEGLQRRLEEATRELRDTKGREVGLQRSLEETARELTDSKALVAVLQQRLDKERQDLMISRTQCEKKQEQLIIASCELDTFKSAHTRTAAELSTTHEELTAVCNQLEVTTRDLNVTRKEKESLERRDEELVTKFKELESWLSSRVCSVTMQSVDEHPPTSSMTVGGKGSHVTTPSTSGWHSNQESHRHQPHHHGHPSVEATGGASGWKTCLTCHTGYSSVDVGGCPKCWPRQACKSGCGKPAFCTLDLGSFSYCSAECRDRCELEEAKRELTRALDEFEVNPGRGSTKTPAREPISHVAMSQPFTRTGLQSDDTPTTTPTTLGGTHGVPPTQQPPLPQEPTNVSLHCKVSRDAVRAMSFYDMGRLQTVGGTKGILVTSIEVNKDTLDCGVQPLDLITQLDSKSVVSLCDKFEQCLLKVKMTQSSADLWVERTPGVPSLSDLQIEGLVKPHRSGRKHRIVGFLVTQKDLVDPASFLGVKMCEYSKRKVEHVTIMSAGYKSGLDCNDIIQSVAMVTAEGVVGPDKEWSFESIKRIARESQSVCALLLTVMNF